MNDTELKTHVSEETHDDFAVLARILGFENKSQFLRFLVVREVDGVLPQLKTNAPGYGLTGRAAGQSRANL